MENFKSIYTHNKRVPLILTLKLTSSGSDVAITSVRSTAKHVNNTDSVNAVYDEVNKKLTYIWDGKPVGDYKLDIIFNNNISTGIMNLTLYEGIT